MPYWVMDVVQLLGGSQRIMMRVARLGVISVASFMGYFSQRRDDDAYWSVAESGAVILRFMPTDIYRMVGNALASWSLTPVREIKYDAPSLATDVAGISFSNCVGFAASSCVNPECIDAILGMGFGSVDVIVDQQDATYDSDTGKVMKCLEKRRDSVAWTSGDGHHWLSSLRYPGALGLWVAPVSDTSIATSISVVPDATPDEPKSDATPLTGIADYIVIDLCSCGDDPFPSQDNLPAMLTPRIKRSSTPVFVNVSCVLLANSTRNSHAPSVTNAIPWQR